MFWLSPLAIVPLLCAGGMLISYAALGLIARPIVGIRGMAPVALFSIGAFLACLIEALTVSANRPEAVYWLEAAAYASWVFLTAALALWFERLVQHSLRLTAAAIAVGVCLAAAGALMCLRSLQLEPVILVNAWGILRPRPQNASLWLYTGLLLPIMAVATTILRSDQRRLPRKTLLAGIAVYGGCLVMDGWTAAAGSDLPRVLVVGLLALQLAIQRATGHKLVAEYLRTRTMNDLRSRMMDSLSHELRTPLGVVKGYLEMTVDGHFGPLSAPQSKALTTALDNVNQEVTLIDDLLLSAQLERGLTALHRESVSVIPLMHQCMQRAARRYRDKSMEYQVISETEATPAVSGDPALLAKLFDRLLDNAWTYAPAGSRVTVEIQSSPDDSAALRISVADQGPGIDPALIEQIAEPFAQASAESEGQVKGLGLGLSLARTISQLHGGQLGLQNNPRGGLIALVTLPRDRRSDPAVLTPVR